MLGIQTWYSGSLGSTAMFGSDVFMMPDDFLDDEVQELLGEIRIQMSSFARRRRRSI